jgi:hypothetical protein
METHYLLNRQFLSVFITAQTSDIPDLDTRTTPPGIRVTVKGVLELLQGLKCPQGYWSRRDFHQVSERIYSYWHISSYQDIPRIHQPRLVV